MCVYTFLCTRWSKIKISLFFFLKNAKACVHDKCVCVVRCTRTQGDPKVHVHCSLLDRANKVLLLAIGGRHMQWTFVAFDSLYNMVPIHSAHAAPGGNARVRLGLQKLFLSLEYLSGGKRSLWQSCVCVL